MMANSRDLSGKKVGAYTLEHLIGRGGMGAVYLAQQAQPERQVAIKLLLAGAAISSEQYDEFLARFKREANVIAKLEHLNIIPIYEYGEQDGLAYLVMPYLPGGSLRDLLAKHGSFTLQEAAIYIEQAAAALDYAHARGIVHRDLKPGNFLLHADGRLVLADFGLACIVEDSLNIAEAAITKAGTLVGTPEYLAPEMALGQEVDHRTDIYELGILLFQMLSGDVPFKGGTFYTVMAKHTHELPPLLNHMNPAIPSIVDAIVQKATAKRREDRYPSAGALAKALRRVIAVSSTVLEDNPDNDYATIALPLSSITLAATSATTGQLEEDKAMRGSTAIATPGDSTLLDTPQPISYLAQRESKSIRRPRGALGLLSVTISLLVIGALFISLQGKGLFSTNPFAGLVTPGVVNTSIINSPVSPTATQKSDQQAQALITQYYADINNGNYRAAYNIWGEEYQLSHDYQQYSSGYAHTSHIDLGFGTTKVLSDASIRVTMTLYATENTDLGTVTSIYKGYYIVGLENGTWKLLQGDFQKTAMTAPIPTPAQQAQAVVRQYFHYINLGDYKAAYVLWGANYQKNYTYAQFVSGYTKTERDDIQMNSASQLSETLVKVTLTIVSTEGTSKGNVMHVYRGFYLVGQENSSWKLLQANFYKVS